MAGAVNNPHLIAYCIAMKLVERVLAGSDVNRAQGNDTAAFKSVYRIAGIIRNWREEVTLDGESSVAVILKKDIVLHCGIIAEIAVAILEAEGEEGGIFIRTAMNRIRRQRNKADFRNRRIRICFARP